MNEYITSPIDLISSRLYAFRFQTTSIKLINEYLNDVTKTHINPHPDEDQLNDEDYWQHLKQNTSSLATLEQAHQQWLATAPFAHIPSSKLIMFLQNTIHPLTQLLDRCIHQIKDDLKTWRPDWIQKYPYSYLQSLRDKKQQVDAYRTQCFSLLIQRSQYHHMGAANRRCDDDRFMMRKHLKGLVHEQVDVPSVPRLGLSDDDRITLFDLLGADDEPIISKIRRTPYPQPNVQKVSATRLNKLKAIHSALGLTSIKIAVKSNHFWSKVNEKLKSIVSAWAPPMQRFLNLLYTFRYVMALCVTLAIYAWLVPPMIALLSVFAPQIITSGVQFALFYGVALAPAWMLGFNNIKSLINRAIDQLTLSKQNQCFEGLAIIQQQNVLLNRLSVGILDTCFYDVNTLQKDLSSSLKALDIIKSKLSQVNPIEKWAMSTKQSQALLYILSIVQNQSKLIKGNAQIFSDHIIQRVKVDLLTLIKDEAFGIKPLMAEHQLKSLRAFVNRFGGELAQKQFDEVSSLVPQLIEQLQKRSLCLKINTPNPLVPWGHFKPNRAALNGWQTLYQQHPTMRDKLCPLISMLLGKESLSPAQWSQISHDFEPSYEIKRLISDYVFHCIHALPSQAVFCLEDDKKQLILKWYQDNQSKIEQAKSMINSYIRQPNVGVLNQIPLEQAANLVLLLDGAKVALTLLGKEDEALNELRHAIEHYDGAHPQIFYLNRFFPISEQKNIVLSLSQKRLTWLMHHPQTKLSTCDIEMLHSPLIRSFNLTHYLINHPSFSGALDLRPLLLSLKQSGLDDGTLLTNYEQSVDKPSQMVTQSQGRAIYVR